MVGLRKLVVGKPEKINYEDLVNEIIDLRFKFRAIRDLKWYIRFLEGEKNINLNRRLIEEKLTRKGRLEYEFEVITKDGSKVFDQWIPAVLYVDQNPGCIMKERVLLR